MPVEMAEVRPRRASKAAVWLVALGYLLLVWLSANSPFWVMQHPEHAHDYPQFVGAWPVSLGVAMGVNGLLLALIPMRRGERWAICAAGVPMLIIGIPRIMTDPRCLAAITTQHGCHTFMAAMLLVLTGCVIAAFRR